jgi:tRNA nucleotidyltransferase (CCA-adding enzyme)
LFNQFREVISIVIPEVAKMFDFNQKNPYHHLDIWKHTVEAIHQSEAELPIRLAMLFHDIGKPHSFSEDENGGHFYGHPKFSAFFTKRILRRLKYDNRTIDMVVELVQYHDATFSRSKKHIRRWLNKIGEEQFRRLLKVKYADTMAHAPEHRQLTFVLLEDMEQTLQEVLEEKSCFSLKDLAVNGRDLIAIGITEGPYIGKILNRLLQEVIDEELMNEKEMLLHKASMIRGDYV